MIWVWFIKFFIVWSCSSLMVRVKFEKGKQREFLKKVLVETNCPSLRAFLQFGFEIPYSSLKNYFNEDRTLPEKFFLELCKFAKLNEKDFVVNKLEENWGQVRGGKQRKKNLRK